MISFGGGVSPEQAADYTQSISPGGPGAFFTTAVLVPIHNTGGMEEGTLLIVSTPESNRMDADHQAADEQGRVFPTPGWTMYDVWMYHGLTLLNFAGILQSQHNGTCMGKLGEFLDAQYPRLGCRGYLKEFVIIALSRGCPIMYSVVWSIERVDYG